MKYVAMYLACPFPVLFLLLQILFFSQDCIRWWDFLVEQLSESVQIYVAGFH